MNNAKTSDPSCQQQSVRYAKRSEIAKGNSTGNNENSSFVSDAFSS